MIGMKKIAAFGFVGIGVLVLFIFIAGAGNRTPNPIDPKPVESPALNLPAPSLELPALGSGAIGEMAWKNFEAYLAAAKDHDLSRLKELSHSLSPACQESSRLSECYQLMDSVYFFAGSFKQKDFKNIAYDARQIVLSTDYMKVDETEDRVKSVLYFTRDEKGAPKILGIRFCAGKNDSNTNECVNTDASQRDRDQNGWWDDVEELFR